MPTSLSNTQIDRLGNRLKGQSLTEDGIRVLDEYRRSFGSAYESVVRIVREELHLEPTGRPAKSTSSLREKLNRESIRLVQVQDIAGCRVVVVDVVEQDRVVAALRAALGDATVIDRRATPSYGYRAVHVVAKVSGKIVEIQVRTVVQHMWAEFSEKLSDVVDPSIKYGGGPAQIRKTLELASDAVKGFEVAEKQLADFKTSLAEARAVVESKEQVPKQFEEALLEGEAQVSATRALLGEALHRTLLEIRERK